MPECGAVDCPLQNFCPYEPSSTIEATEIVYEKGNTVWVQGAPVYGFYVICKGKMKMVRRAPSGKKQIVNILGVGDLLGKSTMLQGHDYYCTYVEAMEDSVLNFIKKEYFQELLKDRETSMRLAKQLARDIYFLMDRLLLEAYSGIKERLAMLLLNLASRFGKEDSNGNITIDVKLTKVDLAEMAGIARETATKHLVQMEERGIVTISSEGIIINRVSLEKLLSYFYLEGVEKRELPL